MSGADFGPPIRRCRLEPEWELQKQAWVAVDNRNNAVAVFAVVQMMPNDPRRVKDCAMYTTPSKRGHGLATDLFLRACTDLASEEPPASLEWSGIATPGGYRLVKRFGFSISEARSAELDALLDQKLAEHPDDERYRQYAAFRDEYGGRLPCEPLRQKDADAAGRKVLHEAAQVLQLRAIGDE
ncbi:hypothetical protein IU483_24750 [Streptomyces gardneri]|nr:hypothetical protein [Streptomyces gardneri]